jgi:hypothetical protein
VQRYESQFQLDEANLLDGRNLQAVMLDAKRATAKAARVRPDLTFPLLLNNPTLDADNTPLFSSSHNNKATGAGSVLQASSLDSGISAIGSQYLSDFEEHSAPVHINLPSAFLIVPPALTGAGLRAIRNMETVSGPKIELRPESRISSIGVVDPDSDLIVDGSSTNWLLAARSATRPSIIVAGLNGSLLPIIRRFDLDHGQWGIAWDIQLSIGVAALDYRGLYWSVGA